jgi:tetraacyldisaccharide 4'-kinase
VRQPAFWQHDGAALPAALLAPLAGAVAAATARRVARPGWRAPVPVICCGNVTVGGSGKTTLALDLLRRLQARGVAAHALLRGYGGSARGTRRVLPGDDAAETGDEALLLAAAAGALVMDDGLQNPTLCKDLSLLVVDGGFGFGNARVLPAGPLREPVASGAARCQAAVLIGPDQATAAAALPPSLPVLRAQLVPGPATLSLRGRQVLGFAGIGRPAKFFATLREAGAVLAETVAFPDHHCFTTRELNGLIGHARRMGALPVTTAKDAMRLPKTLRDEVFVADVELIWQGEHGIDTLLDSLFPRRGTA